MDPNHFEFYLQKYRAFVPEKYFETLGKLKAKKGETVFWKEECDRLREKWTAMKELIDKEERIHEERKALEEENEKLRDAIKVLEDLGFKVQTSSAGSQVNGTENSSSETAEGNPAEGESNENNEGK